MLLRKIEEEWTPIKLKTWVYNTISGCLEARVGGNQVQMGALVPIKDKVLCQAKKTIIHWDLFTLVGKIKPWLIAPDVLLAPGYVRRNLLNKERFHLWECPKDLWMQMND